MAAGWPGRRGLWCETDGRVAATPPARAPRPRPAVSSVRPGGGTKGAAGPRPERLSGSCRWNGGALFVVLPGWRWAPWVAARLTPRPGDPAPRARGAGWWAAAAARPRGPLRPAAIRVSSPSSGTALLLTVREGFGTAIAALRGRVTGCREPARPAQFPFALGSEVSLKAHWLSA